MTEYPAGLELVDSIPQIEVAELVQKGGQKAVYKATIEGADRCSESDPA